MTVSGGHRSEVSDRAGTIPPFSGREYGLTSTGLSPPTTVPRRRSEVADSRGPGRARDRGS
ncbi:hypothetical protein [Frankia sp. CcWB3]